MPMIELNGVEITYQDTGPQGAQAIVFAHSLFFDHRMFEHQIERFSEHYRVIAYDQRSHGFTSNPKNGDYSMDALTSDAASLIRVLELGPVHMVGNSMGGFVALRLGARHPELVRSVTTVGSSADKEQNVEQYRPLVQTLKDHGTAAVMEQLMYTMFGDTTLKAESQATMRSTWRSRMGALPHEIGAAAEAVVERQGVVDELHLIKVPVLAVAGAEDHAYGVDLSEQIAEGVPNGVCIVINAAGHSASLEAPDAVNEALAAHFARAEAAG